VTTWSADEVAAAAAAWVWVPDEARRLEREDYLLIDFPPGYDDECPTQVQWTRSDRDPQDLIDEAVDQTRAWGRARLGWWIRGDNRPATLEPALAERGAAVAETVLVLGLDLGCAAPEGPTLRCEVVRDEQTLRDARTVFREVWGGPEPSAEQRARDLAEVARPVGEREGFQVVAYVDDEPVSAGGCTRAGEVARLWGAATHPRWRGRGAYRVVVAARLGVAREHGATLGLVKGLVTTSAPILTRLGFTTYGEERKLTLEL
jgi:GNAT superfamily N-acetyltransferase